MSTDHTTNYDLNQWEGTDKVLRTEFNADNAKIDAALKNHDDEIAELEAADGALEAAIALKGNCQIEHFTYVGNGAYGNGNPRAITFPRLPLLFFIRSEDGIGMGSRLHTGLTAAFSGSTGGSVSTLPLTWSGNTAYLTSWSTVLDFNRTGETYHVFAFYAEDEES